jgi:hypothetical protein
MASRSTATKPTGATQKEVADALGLTTRQVRNLTDDGTLPRSVKHGKPVYDLGACVQAYIKYKAELDQAKSGGAKEAMATLNARKLAIDVERAELELGKEREQLVTIDFMERQVSGLLQSLRSKCLNFPGKYARELAEATDPADVIGILEDGIAELLTALSETGEDPALDEAEEEPPADAE